MTFGQFMYYDFAYILHPTGSASRCRATIPHMNSETNPPSPYYQCCLQVSETFSWHKLRCCCSANILQHWVGGRGLIYFCKVDQSKIPRNFSRNLVSLNNLCEILQVFTLFIVQVFTFSIFYPTAGKYGPEKLRLWTRFTQWQLPGFLKDSFHANSQWMFYISSEPSQAYSEPCQTSKL